MAKRSERKRKSEVDERSTEWRLHPDPAWDAFMEAIMHAQDLANRLDDAIPHMLMGVLFSVYASPPGDAAMMGADEIYAKQAIRVELARLIRKAHRTLGYERAVTRSEQVVSLHQRMSDVLVGTRQAYGAADAGHEWPSGKCYLCFEKDNRDVREADWYHRLMNKASYRLAGGEAVVGWSLRGV